MKRRDLTGWTEGDILGELHRIALELDASKHHRDPILKPMGVDAESFRKALDAEIDRWVRIGVIDSRAIEGLNVDIRFMV